MKMVVMEYVKMLALEVMVGDVMVVIEIVIEGEAGRSRPRIFNGLGVRLGQGSSLTFIWFSGARFPERVLQFIGSKQ